jgi:hypothetical protein
LPAYAIAHLESSTQLEKTLTPTCAGIRRVLAGARCLTPNSRCFYLGWGVVKHIILFHLLADVESINLCAGVRRLRDHAFMIITVI